MSYTPTEWKAGDLVTSAKLNKIENCLAEMAESDNSEFVIPIFTYNDDGELVCNMTVDELSTAIHNGKKCLGCFQKEDDYIHFYILQESSDTEYYFWQNNRSISFFKEDENDMTEYMDEGPLFISIHENSTNNTKYMVKSFYEISQARTYNRNIIITEWSSGTLIFYHLLKIDSNNHNIYLIKYDFDGNSPSPVYVVYHATSDDTQPRLVNN